MRCIIQRVSQSSVSVNSKVIGSIQKGFTILVGFEEEETEEEMNWLIQKIIKLRVFSDENGLMNHSLLDAKGDVLLVSQFTLHAQTKKGNRPSFIKAAKPKLANKYYDKFVLLFQKNFSGKVECGQFGADMKVEIINDGPVTISIDTKNKE